MLLLLLVKYLQLQSQKICKNAHLYQVHPKYFYICIDSYINIKYYYPHISLISPYVIGLPIFWLNSLAPEDIIFRSNCSLSCKFCCCLLYHCSCSYCYFYCCCVILAAVVVIVVRYVITIGLNIVTSIAS